MKNKKIKIKIKIKMDGARNRVNYLHVHVYLYHSNIIKLYMTFCLVRVCIYSSRKSILPRRRFFCFAPPVPPRKFQFRFILCF